MFSESTKHRELSLNTLFHNAGNFYKNLLLIKSKVCDNELLVSFSLDIKTANNSQNTSAFDNLRVRKISTSKRLRVRIIHVFQTFGKNFLVISPVC